MTAADHTPPGPPSALYARPREREETTHISRGWCFTLRGKAEAEPICRQPEPPADLDARPAAASPAPAPHPAVCSPRSPQRPRSGSCRDREAISRIATSGIDSNEIRDLMVEKRRRPLPQCRLDKTRLPIVATVECDPRIAGSFGAVADHSLDPSRPVSDDEADRRKSLRYGQR